MDDVTTAMANLERGIPLPAAWYTDPAVAARERERIFRRSWQYVGRADQLARAGDFFTATLGDVPVVAVRSERGSRAFVNVCRHRRHEVVSGAGNRRTLQCPYHAWTYDLDGSLRAAPRSQHEDGFDRHQYPLLGAALDTWGPLVFVNLDLQAAPLAAVLGTLPDVIGASGVKLDALRFHSREQWEAEANWKVMIENFLECYHCAIQHPAFSAVVDVSEEAYRLSPGQWSSSQVAPVRESARATTGPAPVDGAGGAVTEAQYHYLWPNLTISINPGPPNLSLDVWMPAGPERTRGFSEHWFGPGVTEEAIRDAIAFNHQVGREDDRLTDSVQRGLRAGVSVEGRLLLRSERLLVHFQTLVANALA
jgi:phenylpropionate dioxygenase-like ring-hydroxylating dioxygenase large terminal subunit